MSADSPAPPCRRTLRARLFWVSRWLLGAGGFHAGSIRVVIDDGDNASGETLVIRPRADDEDVDPDGPPSGSPGSVLAPKLLARLLSADGLAIMRLVAARQPVAAKVVMAGVGFDRSKCYTLLTDLRDRGLIRDTEGGYEVADAEVWAAVSAAAS